MNGTATDRADYVAHYGTLTFNPGETSKTFIVLITDDVFVENDQTLTATLSNPSGSVLGGLNTATLTIVDNDTVQLPLNPVDTARFFVNQHYGDFLNRASDQAGLDFWTNQITSCGSNLSCLQLRRINVSAAFFLSIEFQETGYLVYRTYKAAYRDLPAAPVPVKLKEFLAGYATNWQGCDCWSSGLGASVRGEQARFHGRVRHALALHDGPSGDADTRGIR